MVKRALEGIKSPFPTFFPRQDSAPCGNRSPRESHGGLGVLQWKMSCCNCVGDDFVALGYGDSVVACWNFVASSFLKGLCFVPGLCGHLWTQSLSSLISREAPALRCEQSRPRKKKHCPSLWGTESRKNLPSLSCENIWPDVAWYRAEELSAWNATAVVQRTRSLCILRSEVREGRAALRWLTRNGND